MAEVEYIKYLFDQGGSVSDVIRSKQGNLLEEITYDNHTYTVSVFTKARGIKLVDNHYRYREGAPITEYFYNCGKALGKLHQLSKGYTPVHQRYSFLDKYNAEYIQQLIPENKPQLKGKLLELVQSLKGLSRDRENYGMIHMDYNDGNYLIDFDNGQITVYDFDNSCLGWYMYDLADLWKNGMGWVTSEPDVAQRRRFMEEYFQTALSGYQSETTIDDSELEQLPFFIQVTLMEHLIDEFEQMQRSGGEEPDDDEVLLYLIKCLEDDIPYMGFFHEIYSCEEPFAYVE